MTGCLTSSMDGMGYEVTHPSFEGIFAGIVLLNASWRTKIGAFSERSWTPRSLTLEKRVESRFTVGVLRNKGFFWKAKNLQYISLCATCCSSKVYKGKFMFFKDNRF